MDKDSFITFDDFYKKLTAPVKKVEGGLPPIDLYKRMKNRASKAS